jgi:hypothetical protein
MLRLPLASSGGAQTEMVAGLMTLRSFQYGDPANFVRFPSETAAQDKKRAEAKITKNRRRIKAAMKKGKAW